MNRLALATLALIAFMLCGCSTVDRAGDSAKHALIDCGKQYAPTIAAELARWGVESVIAGKVDLQELEQSAKGLGLGAGSCAVAEFLRAWKARQPVGIAALGGEPDLVTQLHGVLARVSGGVPVRLVDGTEP
jgi:hypothetical protein